MELTITLSKQEQDALKELAAKIVFSVEPWALKVALHVALVDYLDTAQLLDKNELIKSIVANPPSDSYKANQVPSDAYKANPITMRTGPIAPKTNPSLDSIIFTNGRQTPSMPMRERDGKTTMTWRALRWSLDVMLNGETPKWARLTAMDVAVALQIKNEIAGGVMNGLTTTNWIYACDKGQGKKGKAYNVYEFTSNAKKWILDNQKFLTEQGLLAEAAK